MQYFIAFLEGIITFISPCLLPMLPIYISYFAGGKDGNRKQVMKNALGFILGFTALFVLMGALAGTFGKVLNEYKTAVDIITGLIVVFFGLNLLGVFKLNLFKGSKFSRAGNLGFFSSLLFGIVFSISWTPCVGAFLGSALMLAASQGSIAKGTLMLLIYGERETISDAKEYIEQEGYQFEVFFDTKQEAVNSYYVTGFPSTYFIDKDGNLVTYGTGMLDTATLEKGIEMITQ